MERYLPNAGHATSPCPSEKDKEEDDVSTGAYNCSEIKGQFHHLFMEKKKKKDPNESFF